MKFEAGQRVRLIEEQALEDMCPVQVGEEGRIINIELPIEPFDSDMLFVLWDNHPEQDYAVWDYEVELVEQEDDMNNYVTVDFMAGDTIEEAVKTLQDIQAKGILAKGEFN